MAVLSHSLPHSTRKMADKMYPIRKKSLDIFNFIVVFKYISTLGVRVLIQHQADLKTYQYFTGR
jgi:hypothetical protein